MHIIRTRRAALATTALFVTTIVGSLAIGVPSAFGAGTDAANSTVAAAPAAVVADGDAQSTITVTLLDASHTPVVGDDVSLSAGGGSSIISDPSGPSNANGVVTFTVTDDVVEHVTYTATDTTVPVDIAQTATVDFTVGPTDPNVSVVLADPTSIPADGATQTTVTAILLDAFGNPVAGDAVSLAADGGSSIISPPSGPSDANGIVTFAVSDTVGEDVTYTATDTTVPVAIVETATVTFVGPADADQSTVTASPTAVVANGTSTSLVTVTLRDANGNPVVGDAVSLAAGGGSSTISAPSGASNANGVVTFTVKDTAAENVTYTATDTSVPVAITETAAVRFTPAAPAAPSGASSSASGTSTTAQGTATATNAGTTVSATGIGGLTVAQYPSNPVAAPTFVSSGKYLDVAIGAGSTFTAVSISDCDLGAGDALEWFNPAANAGAGAWSPVTPAPVLTTGPPACLSVTLTSASSPSLAQLTGTVFGVAVTPTPPPASGYWLVASDGGIFTHGDAGFFGSEGATHLNAPIVGMATTPDGGGYWLVASDGGIFTHGDAGFFGSQGATHLNSPIVGMASTPDGGGYWLVAADGGIFTHGDAGFFGSEGATHLNSPIVGMASTPDGGGYWLVAADGGIFTHGDAGFFGSQGATHLNAPIVGMAATPDGGGYWLVASDGGIFTHGDAGFFGSQGATHLNAPIVGMAATPDGGGYWLVASDGGIFTHGDAGFFGSQGATHLNSPIVGMS